MKINLESEINIIDVYSYKYSTGTCVLNGIDKFYEVFKSSNKLYRPFTQVYSPL
jgi:hypothetical protein